MWCAGLERKCCPKFACCHFAFSGWNKLTGQIKKKNKSTTCQESDRASSSAERSTVKTTIAHHDFSVWSEWATLARSTAASQQILTLAGELTLPNHSRRDNHCRQRLSDGGIYSLHSGVLCKNVSSMRSIYHLLQRYAIWNTAHRCRWRICLFFECPVPFWG